MPVDTVGEPARRSDNWAWMFRPCFWGCGNRWTAAHPGADQYKCAGCGRHWSGLDEVAARRK